MLKLVELAARMEVPVLHLFLHGTVIPEQASSRMRHREELRNFQMACSVVQMRHMEMVASVVVLLLDGMEDQVEVDIRVAVQIVDMAQVVAEVHLIRA
jgi:hypothetical protein